MKYVKAPPTVDGWYWWRRDVREPAVIREVLSGLDNRRFTDRRPGEQFSFDSIDVDYLGGEWAGPLMPPE